MTVPLLRYFKYIFFRIKLIRYLHDIHTQKKLNNTPNYILNYLFKGYKDSVPNKWEPYGCGPSPEQCC